MRIRRFGIIAVVLWLAAAASCAPAGDVAAESVQASGDDALATPVVREILARTTNPPGAPGHDLTLVRYTIAPGAELAPHVHPGVQLAAIESGTLSYRVISGTATIHRGVDAAGEPASVEQVAGPADTELGAGDVVVEPAELHHFGANRTAAPVIILATLITEAGADLAVAEALPAAE